MPVRSYGHNYLDKTTFLQITLAHGSKSASPVEWFLDDTLFSSSKLTVSLKSTKRRNVSELIPHTISLPIMDDTESFTFQVDSLESLCLEFEIYPTFGSKVIAKGVASQNLFTKTGSALTNGGICVIPLLDPRLQSIGQISFEYSIVEPFAGVQFDIHSRIETYWKSTQTISGNKTKLQAQQHLVTESSLSGHYIWLPIQVTKDNIAVVCSTWMLPTKLARLAINEVNASELEAICHTKESIDTLVKSLQQSSDVREVQQLVASSNIPLSRFLALIHPRFKLHLQILLPTISEQTALGIHVTANINTTIDAILSIVFAHADNLKRATESGSSRSVFFSSGNTTVCTALNWKQPNCEELSNTGL